MYILILATQCYPKELQVVYESHSDCNYLHFTWHNTELLNPFRAEQRPPCSSPPLTSLICALRNILAFHLLKNMEAVAFSSKYSNMFGPRVPRGGNVSSLLSAQSHSTAMGSVCARSWVAVTQKRLVTVLTPNRRWAAKKPHLLNTWKVNWPEFKPSTEM